jgi:hypothetical protein
MILSPCCNRRLQARALTAFLLLFVLFAMPGRVRAADSTQKYPPTIVFMTDFGVVDDSVAICRGVMYGSSI